MMKRYLAHAILDRGIINYTALLSIDGEDVIVEPFERETSSTEFFPGIIIIASAQAIKSAHRDELDRIASTSCPLRQRSTLLDDYMTTHNLYRTSDTDSPEPIFLK